jgi:hypothetical protein
MRVNLKTIVKYCQVFPFRTWFREDNQQFIKNQEKKKLNRADASFYLKEHHNIWKD